MDWKEKGLLNLFVRCETQNVTSPMKTSNLPTVLRRSSTHKRHKNVLRSYELSSKNYQSTLYGHIVRSFFWNLLPTQTTNLHKQCYQWWFPVDHSTIFSCSIRLELKIVSFNRTRSLRKQHRESVSYKAEDDHYFFNPVVLSRSTWCVDTFNVVVTGFWVYWQQKRWFFQSRV